MHDSIALLSALRELAGGIGSTAAAWILHVYRTSMMANPQVLRAHFY